MEKQSYDLLKAEAEEPFIDLEKIGKNIFNQIDGLKPGDRRSVLEIADNLNHQMFSIKIEEAEMALNSIRKAYSEYKGEKI